MRLRTQTRQRNDRKTPGFRSGSIAVVHVCIGMALVFAGWIIYVSVSSVSKTLNDPDRRHTTGNAPTASSLTNSLVEQSKMELIADKDELGTIDGLLDIQPQTNAFTKCMLEMEKELVPLVYELNQQCKPMLHSIKIIDDSFFVLLNTIDLPEGDPKRSFGEAEYACNGIFNGTKVSAYPKKKKSYMVIVECPISIRASQTVLSSVSVRAWVTEAAREICPYYQQESSPISGDSNTPTKKLTAGKNDTMVEYTYNTTKIDQCEREDIRYHEGRGLHPKTGIHAIFIGDRQKAFEWAAYHHLIGFDHVWLYVNDDWNNGKGIVHRDYITWIPYKYNVDEYKYQRPRGYRPTEVFRAAGQVDGLWRAKRMGMDWISLMDLDEYIRLDSPSVSGNETFSSSLEAFGPGVAVSNIDTLPKFLSVFKEQMGEKYFAIRTNSIFYGSGPYENPTNYIDNITSCKSTPLDIDYVWRKKGDVGKHKLTRYKMIVDVSCTLGVFVHYVIGSSCPGKGIWDPNANDLRLNHYKKANSGVYGASQHHLDRDVSMVNTYREKLIGEVCSTRDNNIQPRGLLAPTTQ